MAETIENKVRRLELELEQIRDTTQILFNELYRTLNIISVNKTGLQAEEYANVIVSTAADETIKRAMQTKLHTNILRDLEEQEGISLDWIR